MCSNNSISNNKDTSALAIIYAIRNNNITNSVGADILFIVNKSITISVCAYNNTVFNKKNITISLGACNYIVFHFNRNINRSNPTITNILKNNNIDRESLASMLFFRILLIRRPRPLQ